MVNTCHRIKGPQAFSWSVDPSMHHTTTFSLRWVKVPWTCVLLALFLPLCLYLHWANNSTSRMIPLALKCVCLSNQHHWTTQGRSNQPEWYAYLEDRMLGKWGQRDRSRSGWSYGDYWALCLFGASELAISHHCRYLSWQKEDQASQCLLPGKAFWQKMKL